MAKGDATYSEKIPGERGNYDWPVRFDNTDGFIRITQYEGNAVKEIVLLSPKQVRALVAFAGKASG